MKELKSTIIFKLKHNIFIRLILYPFVSVLSKIKYLRYQKSKYSNEIKRFHNIHKNKRCFIIGNGPSLRPEDLEKLKNEYTFATNRIYYIFDKTTWRPTYYVSTDMDIIRQEYDNISNLDIKYKFINSKAKKFSKKGIEDFIYIFLKGKFALKRNQFVQAGVSDDVSKYFSLTQTVTCICLELAIYMGFKEIYLLGVDHNYSRTIDSKGNLIIDNSVANYFEGMKGGDNQAILYVDDTTASYQMFEDYTKDKDIKIMNATRGGKLEVFQRIDFDSIFANEGK